MLAGDGRHSFLDAVFTVTPEEPRVEEGSAATGSFAEKLRKWGYEIG
jgi:hypothetical protein